MENASGLTLETTEADIAEKYKVRRTLTEKIIKRDGYIWKFHKGDTDHWPSALHAHVANPKKRAAFLHHGIWDDFCHNLNFKNR